MKDLPGNEPVGAGRGPESEEERLLIADLRRVVAARDARRAAWEELDVAPVLDRYRVTRRIGAGGMGVVFAAEQTKPARTVAPSPPLALSPPATPSGSSAQSRSRSAISRCPLSRARSNGRAPASSSSSPVSADGGQHYST